MKLDISIVEGGYQIRADAEACIALASKSFDLRFHKVNQVEVPDLVADDGQVFTLIIDKIA